MPHPLEMVAQNFMQMAQTRFGIDMKNEVDQRDIAQAGSMAAYITGTVMPAEAGEKPIKPQDALKMTVGHANKIGFDPIKALELYSMTKEMAEKASQANNGMGIMEYLKAQSLVGDIEKKQQDLVQGEQSMRKTEQDIANQSPAGIMQRAKIDKGLPVLKPAIDMLRSRVKELMVKNPGASLEQKVDAIGKTYGLEGFMGRNLVKNEAQAAAAITKNLIEMNEGLTTYYDEGEIQKMVKDILINPDAPIDLVGKLPASSGSNRPVFSVGD
jgi:hypothetical protein